MAVFYSHCEKVRVPKHKCLDERDISSNTVTCLLSLAGYISKRLVYKMSIDAIHNRLCK
jgi:hypothetical protein